MSSAKPPGDGGERPSQRISIDDLRLTVGTEADRSLEEPNAFLYAWFQLFKTAKIHDIDNQALVRPVQNFIQVVERTVGREGRISFQTKDRALFLNSVKLRLSSEEFEIAYDTCEFFDERGMGGFSIDGSFDVEGVRRLLRILVYAPPERRRFAALEAELKASGLSLRINKTLGTRGSGGRAEVVLERRAYAFFTYSKLVVLYRSLLAEEHLTVSRRQYLTKKVTRTVQALVDVCLEDDHTFLGISSVKSGEAYAPHHAANTAVLAIALGEKIGLRKVELADMGMAAVFHDVGLKGVPPAILEKKGPLGPSERAPIEQHPLRGVEFLLTEQITRTVLSQIVAIFDHHREVGGGGYPRLSRPPSLLARIIAIADVYDALTSDRPWRKAYLPDEALGLMLERSGTQFDPVLLKVFVNTLGLYPVGTLVRLSTGEIGLVVYGGGEAQRTTRPVVALLGPDGRPGQTVDLIEQDASGGYLRSIVRSEDPAKYGLQVSGLLAQSPGV